MSLNVLSMQWLAYKCWPSTRCFLWNLCLWKNILYIWRAFLLLFLFWSFLNPSLVVKYLPPKVKKIKAYEIDGKDVRPLRHCRYNYHDLYFSSFWNHTFQNGLWLADILYDIHFKCSNWIHFLKGPISLFQIFFPCILTLNLQFPVHYLYDYFTFRNKVY